MRPIFLGVQCSNSDPGHYEYSTCPFLAERRRYWADRELELRLLMDEAEQVSGGTVASIIAYKADHVAAREELKLIDETRRAKKCDGLR